MAVSNGIIYKLGLFLVPRLFRVMTGLLFSTCRIRYHGTENLARLEKSGRPLIASFWHYGVLLLIHLSRSRSWVAMVSASKDGEYVARTLAAMGYQTVRGSRGKGGLVALKEMVKAVVEGGLNAAIVADGSQGPPRIAQAGVILLASRSGAPILPVAWSASRFWTFASWDRTLLPKPFCRIELCYGEPVVVPPKLKAAELEEQRALLEERLNDLYSLAWGLVGREGH